MYAITGYTSDIFVMWFEKFICLNHESKFGSYVLPKGILWDLQGSIFWIPKPEIKNTKSHLPKTLGSGGNGIPSVKSNDAYQATYTYIKFDIYFHDQMHPFNAEMTTKLYSERFTFHFKLLWYDRRQKSACDYLWEFSINFADLSHILWVWTLSDSHMVIQLRNLLRNLESLNIEED